MSAMRSIILFLFFLAGLVLSWAGQAQAAFVEVANTSKGAADNCTISITGVSTSGANLYVAVINHYSDTTGLGGTLADGQGNTWVGPIVDSGGTSTGETVMYYVASPTTSATASFTYSCTPLTDYPTLHILAFSGAASNPLDQTNSASSASSATSIQTGSVTPSVDGELLIAGMDVNSNTTGVAINSSFTGLTVANPGNGNPTGAAAYLIQTTKTAENPTWSWTTSGSAAGGIATFEPTSGPPPSAPPTRTLTGAGQ